MTDSDERRNRLERKGEARACVDLLLEHIDEMTDKQIEFVASMDSSVDRWGASELQLAWLQDLVVRYT